MSKVGKFQNCKSKKITIVKKKIQSRIWSSQMEGFVNSLEVSEVQVKAFEQESFKSS